MPLLTLPRFGGLQQVANADGNAAVPLNIAASVPMGTSLFFQWLALDTTDLSLVASNGAEVVF